MQDRDAGQEMQDKRCRTSMIGNRQGKTEISHDLAEKCSPSGL